jgi:IPT/TIG domain
MPRAGVRTMKRVFSAIFSAVFGLTSCSTFLPDHIATVNPDAITFAILTELYCAATELTAHDQRTLYFASDDWWVAAIEMSLSAQIDASASAGVSLLGPFNLAKAIPVGGTVGSFTSVANGSIDEIRTNLHDYKIYVYINRLVHGYTDPKTNKKVDDWKTFAEQNHWPVHCENPNAGGTYLQGQLGLKDWLAPAVTTQEASVRYAPLDAPPAPPPVPPTPIPTITDVFPRTGSEDKTITITGTNLDKITRLFVGDQLILPGQGRNQFTANATTIKFHPPAALANKGPVNVTVEIDNDNKIGTTATLPSAFTYDTQQLAAPAASQSLALSPTPAPSQSGSAAQSPTISGTFTFTIKSTGTIGPSFTLTRVSGGGGTFFNAARTDTNYVIIALTAAYYCPLSSSLPAPPTCHSSTPARTKQTTLMTQLGQPLEPPPNVDQLSAAIYRLDAAILNQTIAKIAAP